MRAKTLPMAALKLGALTFAILGVTTGCDHTSSAAETIASDIESKVLAKYPDVSPLDRWARFYASTPTGTVKAVYIYANEGVQPIAGRAGQREWVEPEALPEIYDGGCNVLTVEYGVEARALTSVACS